MRRIFLDCTKGWPLTYLFHPETAVGPITSTECNVRQFAI
jgi:hypothetical protein